MGPKAKRAVLGCRLEVFVRTQKCEFVAQAELGNDRVDGPDLNTGSAACVSQVCRGNVIFPNGLDQGQRGETLDDLCACLRAREPLKQFLQDQPCRHYDVCAKQRLLQVLNFWLGRPSVPAKSQRPNACIDKKCHERDRSAL